MKHIFSTTFFFAVAAPAFAQPAVEFAALIQPSAGHTVTFDAARGRIVQFGGGRFGLGTLPGTIVSSAETWEWRDGWMQRHPVNAPPVSSDAALAFDPQRGVSVLFGGGTA